MKEEEKLMKLNLEKENQKSDSNEIKGIKLNFFKIVYLLLQKDWESDFRNILFLILEFLQLLGFSMDAIFTSGFNKMYWYGTISHFFRYCQLVPLWSGNSQFFIISYIITCLYILVFVILLMNIIIQITHYTFKSKGLLRVILILIEFETILNIPFLKTLLGTFTCKNNKLEIAPDIQCGGGLQICLIIISIVLALIFLFLILLFKMTLFDFASVNGSLFASYTSSTKVSLIFIKFILVIIYQFIKHEMALALITFCLSLILLLEFFEKKPFVSEFINKLYFCLYLIFLWSTLVCIIGLLLKNSKFEGNIILLLLGYPFIIFAVTAKNFEFTLEKIFNFSRDNNKNGYKLLIEIQYFLKLSNSLDNINKTKEQKLLYSYINNYEMSCTDENCPLKHLLNTPLKVENYLEIKVFLLQHAEMLYKNAVYKFPFNVKLRLCYGMFLYKKLNKKQKGANEILLLSRYNTNLEDSFLIYKANKFIDEEHEGHSDEESMSKLINTATYKALLSVIKILIGKITMNYIDFWTILAISDENKSENFQKMSKIGSKISKLNEELSNHVEKLERVNLYDQDTVKLYTQFLTEVLNNHSLANTYNTKLTELEQKKHNYNEENLFELNYKLMSRSEEYKYLVVNCSKENFNSICNLSLSICPIFGYSKDELIGRSLNCLLPELFNLHHKRILLDKIDDFKKSLLLKSKDSKNRTESKIVESFGKTKMKYLVPVKLKLTLVSSEEDIIYGIAKIIIDNNQPTNDIEQEVSYVLTDQDFIIRNFSPTAPKLLCLYSSDINNNLDITEYIKEFNDVYLASIDNYEDTNKDNDQKILKQIKIEVLKKLLFGNERKKLIYWKFGDVNKSELRKQKIAASSKSISRLKATDEKYKSAYENSSRRPVMKAKIKNLQKKFQHKFSSEILRDNKTIDSPKEEKNKFLSLERPSEIEGSSVSFEANELTNLNDSQLKNAFYNRPIHHKFLLTVDEVKFNETKVGYLFKFELFKGQNLTDTSSNQQKQYKPSNMYQSNLKMETSDIEKSDISVVSFANKESKQIIFNATENNPNGISLGLDYTFIPKIPKSSQFTIDMNQSCYKQLGSLEKSLGCEKQYESLRQEALEKISKLSKQIKKTTDDSEEEEEEEESYEDSEDDDNNEEHASMITSGDSEKEKKENISEKISQKNLIENINKLSTQGNIKQNENNNQKDSQKNIISPKTGNTNLLSAKSENNSNFNNNKLKEEDYYHVDANKITLFVYNYATGFVEALKDPKFKMSQVIKTINNEKEQLKKMSAKFITNPKLAKEKKRGNSTNKKAEIDEDESDAFSEKKIKLKEIQKALSSKEKQQSIINLLFFSCIIFILIIGSSVVNLLIDIFIKNKLFAYYNLIEQSVLLNKNIIFEINYLREMTFIINHNFYTNRYEKNETKYYNIYAELCYNYYFDTAFVLSNLSTTLNTLPTNQKNKITQRIITIYVLDPVKSRTGGFYAKTYNISIYTAFHEFNAALYHISQIKLEEMHANEENVFYFIRNGMNTILLYAEEQIKIISDEFYDETNKGHLIIIICIIVMVVVYIICFFIFIYFYQKVEERKQSYLSVFYEIGSKFIVTSLTKCEKFSQKIQMQENTTRNQGDELVTLESSTADETDTDNDLRSASSGMKQSVEAKLNNKEKNNKEMNSLKTKICGFIILFILLMVQIASYIIYYGRINLYSKYIYYCYYEVEYIYQYLLPFLGIREYIYDTKKTFYNQKIEFYINNTLSTFYDQIEFYSTNKDKYYDYLPKDYSDSINILFTKGQCELMETFMKEYPEEVDNYTSCDYFFYNTSRYGFVTVLTTFIEEIRMLQDYIQNKVSLNNQPGYNFTYNESYYNSIYYNQLYLFCEEANTTGQRDDEKCRKYKEANTANALKEDSHKKLFIVFRYVIEKLTSKLFDNLFDSIENSFDTTTKISLIINVIFIILVFFGFCLIWLPFVLRENETIFKTKSMLSIIPKEILIALPHINIMLGIDEENKK